VAYFEVKAVPVCPDLPKRRKLNDDLSSYRVDLDIVYVVHKTWHDMFQPTTGFNDSAGVAARCYLIPNMHSCAFS